MNFAKLNPWIPGTILALAAISAPAVAKTHAELASAPGVTATKEGVDVAAMLPAAAVEEAIKARLQWAEACGEVPSGQSLGYSAVLDVDATGAVTQVTRGDSTVTPEAGACIDGVLKELKFAALTVAETTAKVTVSIKLEGREDAPAAAATSAAPAAAPAAVDAAAAPAPAPAPATDAAVAKEEVPSKPWTVRASLNLSAGTGLFVTGGDEVIGVNADKNFRADGATGSGRYLGYSVGFGGSYKFTDLLTASINFAFDQELTETNQATGEASRKFFFRETSIGLGTTGLWKDEQYTGIGVDVSGRVFLPTDSTALQANRVMGLGAGFALKRSFKDIGPGTISLSYGMSVRGNLGGAQKDFNDTRNPRLVTTAAQITASRAGVIDPTAASTNEGLGGMNTMFSLSNRISASYSFLDDFSVGLDYGISNAFQRDATDSDVIANQSIHAVAGGGQTESFSSSIYFGYQLNDWVGLSAGIATSGDPFIFDEVSRSYSVRFPFWDFSEPENNLSTVFLTADFSY